KLPIAVSLGATHHLLDGVCLQATAPVALGKAPGLDCSVRQIRPYAAGRWALGQRDVTTVVGNSKTVNNATKATWMTCLRLLSSGPHGVVAVIVRTSRAFRARPPTELLASVTADRPSEANADARREKGELPGRSPRWRMIADLRTLGFDAGKTGSTDGDTKRRVCMHLSTPVLSRWRRSSPPHKNANNPNTSMSARSKARMTNRKTTPMLCWWP
ncbi:MAG: hypothetical protein BJ554DRAFT_2950, partial [Olpidium bornovanus]